MSATDDIIPTVSVCMITYNHEHFIAQAIESVLMQETDFPVELVIGEDCSTDDTRAIVVEYAQRYPDRISPLPREQNLGMIPNFIATLKACRGTYIAILEGDDYWTDPRKLQKQVDFLEAHPECSMCFHNVLVHYQDGSRSPRKYYVSSMKPIVTLEDLLWSPVAVTCSVVFRNGLLREFPDYYLEAPFGDWPLFILLAQHGNLAYLDGIMAVYRVHSAGAYSGLSAVTRLDQRLWFLERLLDHFGAGYRDILEKLIVLCRTDLLIEECYKAGDYDAAARLLTSAEEQLKAGTGENSFSGHLWANWYKSHVFRAHEFGDSRSVRHALPAAMQHDWRVILNKGVLSIALRAFAGQAVWNAARSVSRLIRFSKRAHWQGGPGQ